MAGVVSLALCQLLPVACMLRALLTQSLTLAGPTIGAPNPGSSLRFWLYLLVWRNERRAQLPRLDQLVQIIKKPPIIGIELEALAVELPKRRAELGG